MAAFMRHQEMGIGQALLQHRSVDDDDRLIPGVHGRRCLLVELRQDVGGDVAIGIVDGGQVAVEFEASALTLRAEL